MRKDALFQRYELFVAAGTLAAHANAKEDWFRQRDVRFLIELFSNWVESSLEDMALPISNTQVSRYLDDLAKEGFARKTMRDKRPLYSLTRVGLIELLTRMVEKPFYLQAEHFFFLYYFIANYRPRIEDLIKAQGSKFPVALKIELEALLDSDALVERQLDFASKELRKLEARVRDGNESAALAKKLYQTGKNYEDVVDEVERDYPYELNSQKPLSDLFGEIPADLGRWELETGGAKRAAQIWKPTLELFKTYVNQLESLKTKG